MSQEDVDEQLARKEFHEGQSAGGGNSGVTSAVISLNSGAKQDLLEAVPEGKTRIVTGFGLRGSGFASAGGEYITFGYNENADDYNMYTAEALSQITADGPLLQQMSQNTSTVPTSRAGNAGDVFGCKMVDPFALTITVAGAQSFTSEVSGAVADEMVVSGATGSPEVNGAVCNIGGYNDGRPVFMDTTAGVIIKWQGGNHWELSGYGLVYFTSNDDVATPDLCTTWIVGAYGSLPLPAVTKNADAEHPLNRVYTHNEDLNGKPSFLGSEGSGYISWTGTQWTIEAGEVFFSSSEDVATPDLVETWTPAAGFGNSALIIGALTLADNLCNGDYEQTTADNNGKPAYEGAGDEFDTAIIEWTGDAWTVVFSVGTYYTSPEDVATPDLVEAWELVTGDGAAPTVTAAGAASGFVDVFYYDVDAE